MCSIIVLFFSIRLILIPTCDERNGMDLNTDDGRENTANTVERKWKADGQQQQRSREERTERNKVKSRLCNVAFYIMFSGGYLFFWLVDEQQHLPN